MKRVTRASAAFYAAFETLYRATCHSGTLARLKAGASVQDIKKQLGHDSLATTDYYIEVLLHEPDAHAVQVESLLL